MSDFEKVPSACGRKSAWVDIFDSPLNPHGVVCCDECRTIIESREAWMDEFGAFIPTFERLSRVPDNDPFYV